MAQEFCISPETNSKRFLEDRPFAFLPVLNGVLSPYRLYMVILITCTVDGSEIWQLTGLQQLRSSRKPLDSPCQLVQPGDVCPFFLCFLLGYEKARENAETQGFFLCRLLILEG